MDYAVLTFFLSVCLALSVCVYDGSKKLWLNFDHSFQFDKLRVGSGTPGALWASGWKNRPTLFPGRMSVCLIWISFECVLCGSLGPLFVLHYFMFVAFCLLVVVVRLSVPVQMIDWKDSSPWWPTMCHSLTRLSVLLCTGWLKKVVIKFGPQFLVW